MIYNLQFETGYLLKGKEMWYTVNDDGTGGRKLFREEVKGNSLEEAIFFMQITVPVIDNISEVE